MDKISLLLCSCNAGRLQANSSESTTVIEQTATIAESTAAVTEPITTATETTPKVTEKSKNYRIDYLGKDADGDDNYCISIFNNSGKIMTEYKSIRNYPRFQYINENVLEMYGGSGNVLDYDFFDVKENRISPHYENIAFVVTDNGNFALVNNNRIVYMVQDGSQIKLIVSDIFDKSKFYKEYKRDFSPGVPFQDLSSAKFIDSNNLQVTYFKGSDFKEVTETIELY